MNEQIAIQNLLQGRLAEIQSQNPGFSLRAFAKKVGIHAGALSHILNGKRNVSRTLAEKIMRRLLLDPQQRSEVLGLFPEKRRPQKAGTTGEVLAPRYLELNAAQFKISAEWEHFAIMSLLNCADFEESPEWIARRLGLSENRAKQVLERLFALGLFERDKDGKITRSKKSFRTTDDVASISLKKHHEQTLEMAKESLHRDPVTIRDFTSVTMAIDPKRMTVAKELIRKYQDDLSDALECGERTEVYRLAIQLFPLTKIVTMITLCLGGLLASLPASAGEKAGNGGGGHLCYTNSTRTVEKSIVAYDLWESSRLRPSWIIPAWNGYESKRQILDRVMAKIEISQPEVALKLRGYLSLLEFNRIVREGKPESLRETFDVEKLIVGENCIYKPLANWFDWSPERPNEAEYVLRDEVHYRKGPIHLDPLNQAALDLHEAAFKTFREMGPAAYHLTGNYSDHVRLFVADAFSTRLMSTILVGPLDGIWGGGFTSGGFIPLDHIFGGETVTFHLSDFRSFIGQRHGFVLSMRGVGRYRPEKGETIEVNHSVHEYRIWRLPETVYLEGEDLRLEIISSDGNPAAVFLLKSTPLRKTKSVRIQFLE